MSLLTKYVNQAEQYINSNCFTVPKGYVDSSLKGFVFSFGASILFAKHNNFGAGLRAGALSVLATTIDAVVRKGITHVQETYFPDLKLGGEVLSDVLKGSFVGALCLSEQMNMQINKKASFLASLALYFFNMGNREKPPIFGFVAHG